MSTSLLYHGWGVRGYQHVATFFEQGTVRFSIEQSHDTFGCSHCGSRQVMMSGVGPPAFSLVADWRQAGLDRSADPAVVVHRLRQDASGDSGLCRRAAWLHARL